MAGVLPAARRGPDVPAACGPDAEMDLSILVEKRLSEMSIEELERLRDMITAGEPPLLLEADNDEQETA